MSTSTFRFTGIFLLTLALLSAGCGGDEVAPVPEGTSPEGPPSPPEPTAAAPTEGAAAPTDAATTGTATTDAATTDAATTDTPESPRRIQFVDGFAKGAALAKEGDILFVYVGRHHPT